MAKKETGTKGMFRRLTIFFLLLAVAAVLISTVERKKSRRATDVEIKIQSLITGDNLINSKDVLTTIDRAFGHQIVGVPLGGLDMERIERVLEADAFIMEADAYIDAENKVHIEVSQREPIVRINDKDGQHYYLDKTGKKMPLSDHYTARVVVATGDIPPYDPDYRKVKRNHLRDVFIMTQVVLSDELLEPLVEQMHISKNGDITLVPAVGRQKIIFGPPIDVDDKINRLKIFYEEAMSRKGWNKYKTINLKFRNQVVCKK